MYNDIDFFVCQKILSLLLVYKTTMSQISYANATFNKVVLEGSDFKDKEAVTASYVNAKIDDLVNGASTSFDTLKELSLALSDGEHVAVAVTSQSLV